MTDRQQRVRDAVAAYWRAHGYAPSITDLEAATGIGRSHLHGLLIQLEATGVVRMERGIPRTVRVTEDATAIREALTT